MKSAVAILMLLSLMGCSLLREPKTPEEEKRLATQHKLLTHEDPEIRAIAKEELESRQYFNSAFIKDPQTDYQRNYNAALIKKREREVSELEVRANEKIATKLSVPSGRSCFAQKFEGEIITGIGLTCQDAQLDLHKKLPTVGILQRVDLEQTKISTGNTYSETSILRNKISANIDTMLTQNCKTNGLFAISAIIPEHSINYIPDIVPHKSDVAKQSNFKYAHEVCGDDMYSVIVSMNDHFDIAGGKVAIRNNEMGIHRVVVCGQFSLKTKWFNHGWTTDVREIFANRYNLIYLGSYRNKDIRDYSKEFHLEMIKNAIAKK